MRPRRVLVGSLCAPALLLASLPLSPAGAAVTSADRAVTAAAVEWLATQQQEDGGFEVAKFPGFETSEAVLALASNAQTGATWSASQARLAVQSVATDAGLTALDHLDDYAEATGDDALTGGAAAKLIALVAAPLCLTPSAFDPQDDGAVDLLARVESARRDNGAYGPDGVFSDTLYAAVAIASVGRAVPTGTIEYIRAAQEADGSWNFAADPAPAPEDDFDDIDTTALAVQALLAAGLPASDPDVAQAVAFLVDRQDDDGSWNFGDPNSTSLAYLALVAAGANPVHDAKAFLRAQQADDGRIKTSYEGSFGVNTYATTQTVRGLLDVALPVVAAADSCPGQGYYLFAADGGVFTFGDSAFYGSLGALELNSPIVAGTVTPTGRGYYLFAADGGVFTFGDARFFGSMGAVKLNSPIVAGASTPTGRGYVLFAADGGVFTFGDARFFGSMGATPLNKPIVAAATTPTGDGYLMVAGDGGVFTFGDAPFGGSLGGKPLNQPIVSGTVTRTGEGYLLVARDGGVFTFGDAEFEGSLGAIRLNQPIVAGGIGALGEGYALFAADGGVFTFGAVPFVGSAGSIRLNSPIVGGAID